MTDMPKIKVRYLNQLTLVEIAIVMVIIGLLIGGVLKGQQMIKNAKIKRVVKTSDEIRAAIFMMPPFLLGPKVITMNSFL